MTNSKIDAAIAAAQLNLTTAERCLAAQHISDSDTQHIQTIVYRGNLAIVVLLSAVLEQLAEISNELKKR
jgi:hypothetical protein